MKPQDMGKALKRFAASAGKAGLEQRELREENADQQARLHEQAAVIHQSRGLLTTIAGLRPRLDGRAKDWFIGELAIGLAEDALKELDRTSG